MCVGLEYFRFTHSFQEVASVGLEYSGVAGVVFKKLIAKKFFI